MIGRRPVRLVRAGLLAVLPQARRPENHVDDRAATVELGGPRPAIIVPLTGPDDEQVFAQAAWAAASPAGIVEWRVDLFDEPTPARAGALATEVAALAASAGVELVDTECARPGAAGLVAAVHEAGGYVVGSFHDVAATPCVDEMFDQLRAQAAAGG